MVTSSVWSAAAVLHSNLVAQDGSTERGATRVERSSPPTATRAYGAGSTPAAVRGRSAALRTVSRTAPEPAVRRVE